MYKQIIAIVFVLSISANLLAQEYQYIPFPDSGVVWSEMYSSEKTMVVYERFTMTGEDTVINDISYKKLYIFYDKTFDKNNAQCIGGIREDDQKRVYYNGEGVHSFKPLGTEASGALLYDFSVSIGDTIKNGNSSHGEIVVMDIDTIKIGNSLRKVFHVGYDVTWIEGIGNLRGLLFTSGDLPTGGASGDLICFIKEDTILYHNDHYDNCFPVNVGVESKPLNFNIQVLPNPANGSNIRFEWGNSKIESIEIFNMKGILIGSVKSEGENFVEYPAKKLNPGIYFYKATGLKNTMQTGKFVVQ